MTAPLSFHILQTTDSFRNLEGVRPAVLCHLYDIDTAWQRYTDIAIGNLTEYTSTGRIEYTDIGFAVKYRYGQSLGTAADFNAVFRKVFHIGGHRVSLGNERETVVVLAACQTDSLSVVQQIGISVSLTVVEIEA